MSETAKTQGKELDALDLLDAINIMTDLANCALTLIADVRYRYFECPEGKKGEMLQQLCFDHTRIGRLLQCADIVLCRLRDVSAEATETPTESIQV